MNTLASPPVFRLARREQNHLVLESDGAAVAHVFVLEDDIVRILVLPDGNLKFPKTWAIAPGLEDVPTTGRDRFDLGGFALPTFELREAPGRLVVETARLRLTVRLQGLFLSWDVFDGSNWQRALRDRPT